MEDNALDFMKHIMPDDAAIATYQSKGRTGHCIALSPRTSRSIFWTWRRVSKRPCIF